MAATGIKAPTAARGLLKQPQLNIVGYILKSLPSDIMVFFTCNACGQSIKKAQVEKHYLTQCRNCEVLSCIDCGKDFVGDDYKHHTKCISENEKYGGKDYNAKPNKGEVKQSQWIECIQAVSSSHSVSPRAKNLLQRLASFDNIPRKKEKFKRFVQNSLKVWDDGLVEEIWTVFSEAGKKSQANAAESAGVDSSQEQRITASCTGKISEKSDSTSGQPAKHSKKAGKHSANHVQDASRNEIEGKGKTLETTRCSNSTNEEGDGKPAKKKQKKECVDVTNKSDEKRPIQKEVFSRDVSHKDIETLKHKKKRKHKEKCLGDEMNAVDKIGGSSKDDSGDGEPRKKKKKNLEGANDTEKYVGLKDEEMRGSKERDLTEGNIGLGNGELPKKKKKKHKDAHVDKVLNGTSSQGECESPTRKKNWKKGKKEQQCDGEGSMQCKRGLDDTNGRVEHGSSSHLLKKKSKKKHADVHTSNEVHTQDKHEHSKKSKSEKDGSHKDRRHKEKTLKGATEKTKSNDSAEDGLLSVATKKKRKKKSNDRKDEVSRLTGAESEGTDGLLSVVESSKKAKKKRKQKDTSTDIKIDNGKI